MSAAGMNMSPNPRPAPAWWRAPAANESSTFHQLSPYIGKLKSTIARDLVTRFSKPNDLVLDPFAGAGTIPLECMLLGRRSFAADISPYARVLCCAKMAPPASLDAALRRIQSVAGPSNEFLVDELPRPPIWVRRFFHPHTLRDVLRFATTCRQRKDDFLLACLLGILHHQRPGFLSYPSSHLVPYLRDKKFPRSAYPELYAYRPLLPRLEAKARRTYRRPAFLASPGKFVQSGIETLAFPRDVDAIITSPPYMNALDYGRDNRLRLWFIQPQPAPPEDPPATRRRADFLCAMTALARKADAHLRKRGHCILVVGENVTRNANLHPTDVVRDVFSAHAPSLRLVSVIVDSIPDIRRARRDCTGTKQENVLVYRKR